MQRGFTLIEVIMVIIILGFISLGFSQGLITIMAGRELANATHTTLGKGQIALMRLTKEISQRGVAFLGDHAITVKTATGSGTYQITGNTITIDGDVLVDTVVALDFRYYNAAEVQVPATTPVGMVATAEIELVLAEPNTGQQSFTTRMALTR